MMSEYQFDFEENIDSPFLHPYDISGEFSDSLYNSEYVKQKYVLVQLVDPLFYGYRYYLPRYRIPTISEKQIIKELKNDMEIFFKSHNMIRLTIMITDLNLHIKKKFDLMSDVIYVWGDYDRK